MATTYRYTSTNLSYLTRCADHNLLLFVRTSTVKNDVGVPEIAEHIVKAWQSHSETADAAHSHGHGHGHAHSH